MAASDNPEPDVISPGSTATGSPETDPADEPDYRQLGEAGNPFARAGAKAPGNPDALVEDGAAPDERALDPHEDDELHRSE